MGAEEFGHAVLAQDGLQLLNVDGRGMVDLHGLFAQNRSQAQSEGAVHHKYSKQGSYNKRKPGVLDEPKNQVQKGREQKEIIDGGKYRPKERVLGTNDSPKVSPFFGIIPKANFHSFDEDDAGNKFYAGHDERHKDNHKRVVRRAAAVHLSDGRFQKA